MTDYTRHPDWLALLRGVCEDPADDVVRYAISDWLEEFGTPEAVTRGRFVRADVRLAATGLDECPTPKLIKPHLGTIKAPCRECEYCLLWRDRWNLAGYCVFDTPVYPGAPLSPGGPHWPGRNPACPAPPPFVDRRVDPDIPAQSGDTLPTLYLHRGFFWHMRCTVAEFTGHAAAIFAAHPITTVTLSDRGAGHFGQYHLWTSSEPEWVAQRSFCIPPELFDALPRRASIPGGGCVAEYRSRNDAMSELSDAATSFGRHRAELPALHEAVPA